MVIIHSYVSLPEGKHKKIVPVSSRLGETEHKNRAPATEIDRKTSLCLHGPSNKVKPTTTYKEMGRFHIPPKN
jgi:hypothetical protein